MSFYERHGIVRATQWRTHGDHPDVLAGVHCVGGLVDIGKVAPYSRRHVEPGDWIVAESDGTLSVLRDDEFKRQYKGV